MSLRLTERDYEILHFLFDQKFASLEALYYRFFDGRKSMHELPPREFFVARQRLGLLKHGGLILSQRVYSEAKSVYLLSRLGLKALQGKLPEVAYASAIQEVDFRNYDHDRRVNLVRVALEREKKAWNWISERRIRVGSHRPKASVKNCLRPWCLTRSFRTRAASAWRLRSRCLPARRAALRQIPGLLRPHGPL